VPTEKLKALVTSAGNVIVKVENVEFNDTVDAATVPPVTVTTRSELGAAAFRSRMVS
jgi:hypothetical protein